MPMGGGPKVPIGNWQDGGRGGGTGGGTGGGGTGGGGGGTGGGTGTDGDRWQGDIAKNKQYLEDMAQLIGSMFTNQFMIPAPNPYAPWGGHNPVATFGPGSIVQQYWTRTIGDRMGANLPWYSSLPMSAGWQDYWGSLGENLEGGGIGLHDLGGDWSGGRGRWYY